MYSIPRVVSKAGKSRLFISGFLSDAAIRVTHCTNAPYFKCDNPTHSKGRKELLLKFKVLSLSSHRWVASGETDVMATPFLRGLGYDFRVAAKP